MKHQVAYNQMGNANYIGDAPKPIAPRTVLSAVSRMGDLNDRLSKLRDHLSAVAGQIGGPQPVGEAAKAQSLPAPGVVGQLNESADYAHDYVSQIEDIVAGIGRSLG